MRVVLTLTVDVFEDEIFIIEREIFCQNRQEKNAAGFVFFIPIMLTYFDIFVSQNQLHDIFFFFFMGFINDFQMGTIDHFMHPSLLTSNYRLISIERCWEPRICISYLSSLIQVNLYYSETKLCLHFSGRRRFLLFNYHLCRPQPSDLSGIICHLLNYLYLLTSFLFTHEFA